ncbi:DUF7446 family protein [Pseudomonas marincola]|uniref:DUF7446 family protein n=1 Tax=Pseudomonas marincola TaxID=437900 RepID=UPI003B838AC7
MANLHVVPSPLTNRIYCGGVAKNGQTWLSNKTDVTGETCAAVAMHVIQNGAPVVVTANGVPVYRITVEKLDA